MADKRIESGEKASQFHYGSIKTICAADKYLLFLTKSQFHYGSIKTEMKKNEVAKGRASQFHYGSIKTYVFTYNRPYSHISLNSTMVRLKHRDGRTVEYSKSLWVSIPLWFD